MAYRFLQRLFGSRRDDDLSSRALGAEAAAESELDLEDGLEPGVDEAVALEITDTLDLHTFPPRDVADLVREWLDLAYDEGFRELRIIHGKGKGVQRRIVRSILERDPRVVSFGDPGDSSSWGATRVLLE
ncbi:MAG: Smr/MutS family protein [Acidobacteriota bacterium]